jgi:hypothetical protein
MKTAKVWLAVAAVLAAVMVTGCASIATGSDQSVAVHSEPAGASVKVFDASGLAVQESVTPAELVLKKGSGWFQPGTYRVVVSKPGFRPQEIVVRGTLNAGWYILGNFVVGGLIGWLVVDPLSGAMWTLAPEDIGVRLEAQASSAEPKSAGPLVLNVALLGDVPEEERGRLVPLSQ